LDQRANGPNLPLPLPLEKSVQYKDQPVEKYSISLFVTERRFPCRIHKSTPRFSNVLLWAALKRHWNYPRLHLVLGLFYY
jgi:hypothetical protein